MYQSELLNRFKNRSQKYSKLNFIKTLFTFFQWIFRAKKTIGFITNSEF